MRPLKKHEDKAKGIEHDLMEFIQTGTQNMKMPDSKNAETLVEQKEFGKNRIYCNYFHTYKFDIYIFFRHFIEISLRNQRNNLEKIGFISALGRRGYTVQSRSQPGASQSERASSLVVSRVCGAAFGFFDF